MESRKPAVQSKEIVPFKTGLARYKHESSSFSHLPPVPRSHYHTVVKLDSGFASHGKELSNHLSSSSTAEAFGKVPKIAASCPSLPQIPSHIETLQGANDALAAQAAHIDATVQTGDPRQLAAFIHTQGSSDYNRMLRSFRYNCTKVDRPKRLELETKLASQMIQARTILGRWQSGLKCIVDAEKSRDPHRLEATLNQWNFSDEEPRVARARRRLNQWKTTSKTVLPEIQRAKARGQMRRLKNAVQELEKCPIGNTDLSGEKAMLQSYDLQCKSLQRAVAACDMSCRIRKLLNEWSFDENAPQVLAARTLLVDREAARAELKAVIASSKNTTQFKEALEAFQEFMPVERAAKITERQEMGLAVDDEELAELNAECELIEKAKRALVRLCQTEAAQLQAVPEERSEEQTNGTSKEHIEEAEATEEENNALAIEDEQNNQTTEEVVNESATVLEEQEKNVETHAENVDESATVVKEQEQKHDEDDKDVAAVQIQKTEEEKQRMKAAKNRVSDVRIQQRLIELLRQASARKIQRAHRRKVKRVNQSTLDLRLACCALDVSGVCLALKQPKVDVNWYPIHASDPHDQWPLMIVANLATSPDQEIVQKAVQIIHALADAGANVNLCNEAGERALDRVLAKTVKIDNNPAILALLGRGARLRKDVRSQELYIKLQGLALSHEQNRRRDLNWKHLVWVLRKSTITSLQMVVSKVTEHSLLRILYPFLKDEVVYREADEDNDAC